MNKCFSSNIPKSTFRKLSRRSKSLRWAELDRGAVSVNHGITLSNFHKLG
jgi:hypothetical protein